MKNNIKNNIKDDINYLLCYRKINPLYEVCFHSKRQFQKYIFNLQRENIKIEGYLIGNGKNIGKQDIKFYDLINGYKPNILEFCQIKKLVINRNEFLKHVEKVPKIFSSTKDIF